MNDLRPTASSTDELREFVGPNADYYLYRWSETMSGGTSQNGFNWPAFLWAGIWFPYRKMYRAAVIFYGVGFISNIVSTILYFRILQQDDISPYWTLAHGLLTGVICGMYANVWYYQHARHIIERSRQIHSSGNDYALILRERGGTSVAAAIGFVLMAAIVNIMIVAVLMAV